MRCVVGIDLGSTTTKAVILDEGGAILGQGITNSRSNYEVACAVAHEEAVLAARRSLLEREIAELPGADDGDVRAQLPKIEQALRLEIYLGELEALRVAVFVQLEGPAFRTQRVAIATAAGQVLDAMEHGAPDLFLAGVPRRSDFFRDLAGAAFMAGAERVCADGPVPFDRLAGLFDRAILEVEVRPRHADFERLLPRALDRVLPEDPPDPARRRERLAPALARAVSAPIDEVAFVGTGYGRQTLPFPADSIRSEILCHGRGAHDVFPDTRTVLDIGGQDTKAIQVDEHGVVSTFQMNDRCAAGCGRYLGYIADELNIGLHELGPLALQARRMVRVNSTCTVFAGAELRDRLALGQSRADVLAGLHRAMMLRAMSLLARSGGISDAFTFTGGVCKNPMATKILRELVDQNYGTGITLHVHADSIYMGARGAALFALDDLKAGRAGILPAFGRAAAAPDEEPPCGRAEPARRQFGAEVED